MAEIGRCSSCSLPIQETHPHSWCTACGTPLADEIKVLLPNLAAAVAARTVPPTSAADLDRGGQSTSAISSRYRDAYRVGAALVGVGTAIKWTGFAAGAATGLLLIGVASTVGSARPGLAELAATTLVAALVVLPFWICGVVVAAQGQILRATLDTAVAMSPFLTDADRLDAMGLR